VPAGMPQRGFFGRAAHMRARAARAVAAVVSFPGPVRLEHGVALWMFVLTNFDMLIGLVDGLGLLWLLTTRALPQHKGRSDYRRCEEDAPRAALAAQRIIQAGRRESRPYLSAAKVARMGGVRPVHPESNCCMKDRA
jgi:hypothetical protein